MIIREMEIKDLMKVAEMLCNFSDSSNEGKLLGVSKDIVAQNLIAIMSTDLSVILVSEEGDELTGLLASFISPHFGSNTLIATELYWWVEPAYRKTRAGLALLNKTEEMLKERGVEHFYMTSIIEDYSESVVKLLERKDYEQVEIKLRKTL